MSIRVSRVVLPGPSPWWSQPFRFIGWWYTLGMRQVAYFALFLIALVEDQFSFFTMIQSVVRLQPLHQDYSVIGRLLGVLIRMLWLALGLLAMVCVLAVALGLVFGWVVLLLAPVGVVVLVV